MPPSSDTSAVCLGLGLSAKAEFADVVALVEAAVGTAGLRVEDLASMALIESRRDHPLVPALADQYGLPFRFFDIATLEEQTPRLANPSEALFMKIGCHGVAEAAALAAAGRDSRLLLAKQKGKGVTVAIAGPANFTR